MVMAFAIPSLKAQNPAAIYIGSWDGMTSSFGSHGVGTPITPNTNDPKLTYNPSTGCYEGTIYDWAKSMGTAAWNAKIPYSFEGDEVTYYSGTAYTNIVFSSSSTATFSFIASEDPAELKGYNLSGMNKEDVYAANVSLNLETSKITFTQIENVSQAPTLLSINPANGSTITPDKDGTLTITLTFSGAVSSMRVLVEGGNPKVQSTNNGSVWAITINAEEAQESVNENSGLLMVKIDQVYAGNTPVPFEDGNLMLWLSYSVVGVSNSAKLEFTGNSEETQLAVYKSPFYTVGTELAITDNSLEDYFASSVTYLFTVAPGYEISISSSANPEDWSIGTAWSIKSTIDPDSETYTEENYREGTTLTILSGAKNETFTITISSENTDDPNAGVNSIPTEDGDVKVYNLNGVRVNPSNITPGIYIINGKKVRM